MSSTNQNEALMEKQQLVKENIKQLQTIDGFLLKEMQKSDKNQVSYLAHIKNLGAIRQNLFELLKNEYDVEIDKMSLSNKQNEESKAMLKISEDALNTKKKGLQKDEEMLKNKRRMIQIGNYEFERYQKHKKLMKTLAYTCFGVFICFFLQKQQIIPEFLSKIGIIFSSVLGVIFLIKILIDMWYRNNLNYSKYDFGFWYEPKEPTKKKDQESRWTINKRGFYKLLGWGSLDGRDLKESQEQLSAERSFSKQNPENNNPSMTVPSYAEQLNKLFNEKNCPPEAQRQGYCKSKAIDNNMCKKFGICTLQELKGNQGSP